VAPEDVVSTFADTAAIAIGFRTMASRSTSAARDVTSSRLCDKVFAIAANLLECAPLDLELRAGEAGGGWGTGGTGQPR
jgi:carbon-monoxide dehydrogenase large subunit